MKKELNLDYKCNVTLEKNNVLIERKLRDHGKVRVTEYTEEDGLEDQLAKNEDDKKVIFKNFYSQFLWYFFNYFFIKY